jgi:hypothetical protein
MMLAVWYILPYSIYTKSSTFKETFTFFLNDENIVLQNHKGEVTWKWNQFSSFFESPNFFHLYFTSKTFFLIPKDEIGDEVRHELRGLFNKHIG